MKEIHYVYRVQHKETKKEYIGCRSSNEIDIGEKYFTSSKDEEFREDFIENSNNYNILIEGDYYSRKESLDVEIFLHHFYDVGKNPMFYNKSKQTSTGFDTTGRIFSHSDETKRKIGESLKGKKRPEISKRMKGENHPLYGKHHSEKTKQKLSESHKGNKHSEKTKQKLSEINKGKKLSKETKEKISESRKNKCLGELNPMYGKHHSEDTKRIISEKIKNQSKIECPHCKNSFAPGVYKRWHGKNCKLNDSFWEEW
jgi:hypothetical protein